MQLFDTHFHFYGETTVEDYVDCDCQVWVLEKFVQNRYFIHSKKFGATLYDNFGSNNFRLYAVNEGADEKFAYNKAINCNLGVAAIFEIKNV